MNEYSLAKVQFRYYYFGVQNYNEFTQSTIPKNWYIIRSKSPLIN